MEGGSIYKVKKHDVEEHKPSSSNASQRLLAVTRDGSIFYKLNEGSADKKVPATLERDKDFPIYPTAQVAKFAPFNGQIAVIVDEIGIHFIDCQTGKETRLIVRSGVNAFSFSPRDSYLVTCEKYQQGEKNLVIWDCKTGKEVAEFEWKKTSKEGPKSVKFSKDEKFCARQTSKTLIEVYENGNFQQPKVKIIASEENLTKKSTKPDQQSDDKKGAKGRYWFDGFEFIPSDLSQHHPNQFFLAWQNCEGLSEKQDVGGNVYAFDLNQNPEKPKFVVQCSKAQEILVRPSPTGHAILIWSQNFVDSSGKSYYGEHSCQYVQLHGGKQRVFVPVFDGMIHDLVWVPSGEQFIVVSGMQPSVSTLYDKNSNPIFEFGKRYRNTVRICPFSQTALIAGFGNLAGEVDFWNLENHSQIGKTKAYCSVGVEWAPNGKHLLSSVLHERVKVDNEIRIYMANGQLLCNMCFKDSELHSCQWQPYPQGTFQKPDLRKIEQHKEESKEHLKPKRLFNPPGGNSVFSQIMRQEMSKTNEKGPKKVDKDQYKDLMKEQAEQHANYMSQSNPADSPPVKEAWRKNDQYQQEQQQTAQATQFSIEEKKVSKHAKRRANKKKKIVVGGVAEGEGEEEDQ